MFESCRAHHKTKLRSTISTPLCDTSSVREQASAAGTVFEACETVIRGIVAQRLGGSGVTSRDIEDVCSEAMLALLSRVQDAGDAIENPGACAAVVAYHACDEYFRGAGSIDACRVLCRQAACFRGGANHPASRPSPMGKLERGSNSLLPQADLADNERFSFHAQAHSGFVLLLTISRPHPSYIERSHR